MFIGRVFDDRKKKMLTIVFAAAAFFLIALIFWIIWGNTALQLNTYTGSSNQLPGAFDGYRIAHISDLHNAEMGKDNENLIHMLQEARPDLIAITGDLIDSRRTRVDLALRFVGEAVKIAPCFYVPGNHEAKASEYADLKNGLIQAGVTVLEDERIDVTQNGARITLIGVSDPRFHADGWFDDEKAVVDAQLKKLAHEKDPFTVLLSHRPELFEIYASSHVDVVLSGHAHGGQFRLPFIGGLVAPNQGLFPKYDAGLYTKGDTKMIVSRGIGNSLFPFRFNNRPEVLLIELKCAAS